MKKNAMWILAMFLTALLSAFIAGCGGSGQSGAGGQQTAAGAAVKYPTRPIEFIVPWGPGGGADQMARLTGKNAENHSCMMVGSPMAIGKPLKNVTARRSVGVTEISEGR